VLSSIKATYNNTPVIVKFVILAEAAVIVYFRNC